MSQIIPVLGEAAQIDKARCFAVVDFLHRREQASGGREVERPATTVASALLSLFQKGLLHFSDAREEGIDVFYVPSQASAQRVFNNGQDNADFPEPIQKKQAAAFRATPGALFRMLGEQEGQDLEIFITDWSPCPAAGAVAIHRSHRFAADLDKTGDVFFTGRFVRHPLTGDLLPVWVADWVKPNFGTGAVLVNPAHDNTDLEFGRRVGLPIRFGLVPTGFDGSPETWPKPPVIKTGKSIKTGFYDGLSVPEATQTYFDALAANGLAVRQKDLQAGHWRIARLGPAESGELSWDSRKLALVAKDSAGSGTRPVGVVDAELLEAVIVTGSAISPVLVCPASEQTESLLALRLLSYDLWERSLVAPEVLLVQKVQESKIAADPEVLGVAMLAGAPLQQVLTLKQQVIEQAQRFLRVHRDLHASAQSLSSAAVPAHGSKQAEKAKAAALEGDPAKAFSFLYQLQKQIEALPAEKRTNNGDLTSYFAVANILLGISNPQEVDPREVWQQM